MSDQVHPAAPHHLPFFIPGPDGSDTLIVVTGIFLVAVVFWVGTLYWKLHSLPERMAHKTHKLQFEFVAVLGLISLFPTMIRKSWKVSASSALSNEVRCRLRIIKNLQNGTFLV